METGAAPVLRLIDLFCGIGGFVPSPIGWDLSCLGSNDRNSRKVKPRCGPGERARASHWVAAGGWPQQSGWKEARERTAKEWDIVFPAFIPLPFIPLPVPPGRFNCGSAALCSVCMLVAIESVSIRG